MRSRGPTPADVAEAHLAVDVFEVNHLRRDHIILTRGARENLALMIAAREDAARQAQREADAKTLDAMDAEATAAAQANERDTRRGAAETAAFFWTRAKAFRVAAGALRASEPPQGGGGEVET